MNDSLKKRFSFKLITNLFSLSISSIITIIVPRLLGPSNYGDFTFLNDHFKKIIGFFGLGAPMGFFVKISTRREEIKLLRYYIYFLFFILISSSIVLWGVYFFNLENKIYLNIKYQFVLLSYIFSFLLFLIEIFRQINDAYGFTVVSEKFFLFHRILSLLIIVFLAYFGYLNLLIYFLHLIFVSSILLFFWFLFLNKKNIKPFAKKYIIDKILFKKYTIEMYLYSHPLFVKGLIVLIVGLSERWLLQYYGGSEEQGFYSFSFAIASIVILFTTSISPIFTTDFSIAWHNKDFIKMRKLFNTLVPSLVFLTAFLSFYVASNGVDLIYLIGGKSFEGAGLSLMLMALYPIHQTYGQLCGAVLYSSGKTKIIRNISIPFQLIGLLLVIYLISSSEAGGMNLGSVGLVYKMILLQIMVVNIYLWYCTKILSLSFFKYFFFQILIILILLFLSFGTAFLFKNITNYLIINLIIIGVSYSTTTFIVIYFFPSLISLSKSDLNQIFNKILNFKNDNNKSK